MARYTYHRSDANQQSIIDDLRQIGCNVLSLSAIGNGCPDLLCECHGKLILLEVKDGKGKLRPAQIEFQRRWVNVAVVRNTKEAFEAIGVQI